MIFFKKKPFATLNSVEILSKNILYNLSVLQKASGGKVLFPVLKSNAYGHGIQEISIILKKYKTPYIAVDSYAEALKIWKIKKRPVLILGGNVPENIPFFRWKYTTLCISDFEILKKISSLNKKIKIHLFINTGMNREGFSLEDLSKVLKILKKNRKIELEGVLSHLASADDEKDTLNTKQNKVFSKCLDTIFKADFSPKYIHLQNSAGTSQNIFDTRINACRPGIAIYGINPLPPKHSAYKKLEKLKPAMRIFSTVTNIQKIKKGEKVSYNGTFTTKEERIVGILPIGYQEFLDRRLSNCGSFLSGKTSLSLLGRVCMNLCCFDTGKKKIKIGEKIKVLSEKKRDENSAENIAKKIGTIPYEVLTGTDASMRRTIV